MPHRTLAQRKAAKKLGAKSKQVSKIMKKKGLTLKQARKKVFA